MPSVSFRELAGALEGIIRDAIIAQFNRPESPAVLLFEGMNVAAALAERRDEAPFLEMGVIDLGGEGG